MFFFHTDDCIGWEERNDYHPVGCGCTRCFPHLVRPKQRVNDDDNAKGDSDDEKVEQLAL